MGRGTNNITINIALDRGRKLSKTLHLSLEEYNASNTFPQGKRINGLQT